MRVGFDISQLAHQGGVGVYTQNLAEQLSKIADLEMVYFYSSLRKPYKGKLKNVKSYRLPPTLFEMLFNRWRNMLYDIKKHFSRVKEFHKDQTKLSYEEKVAQVIELQKIDIEFNKHKNITMPSYKKVWNFT